jgi:hypothetical protein
VLLLDHDPVVVEAGEQIALVEGDCCVEQGGALLPSGVQGALDGLLKFRDIERIAALGVEAHGAALGENILTEAPLRAFEHVAQGVEGIAQVRVGAGFVGLAPEERSQNGAWVCSVAIDEQIR